MDITDYSSRAAALRLLRSSSPLEPAETKDAVDQISQLAQEITRLAPAADTSTKAVSKPEKELVLEEVTGDGYLPISTPQALFRAQLATFNFVPETITDPWERETFKAKEKIGFLIGIVAGSNFGRNKLEYADLDRYRNEQEAEISSLEAQGLSEKAQEKRFLLEQGIEFAKDWTNTWVDIANSRAADEVRDGIAGMGLAQAAVGAGRIVKKDASGNNKISPFQIRDVNKQLVAEMHSDGTVSFYNQDGSVKQHLTRTDLCGSVPGDCPCGLCLMVASSTFRPEKLVNFW